MLANLLKDFGHKLDCARKWSLPVATPSLKKLKPFDAGGVIGLGDGIEYVSRTLADGYDKGGKKQAVLLSCVRLPATAEHVWSAHRRNATSADADTRSSQGDDEFVDFARSDEVKGNPCQGPVSRD